MVHLPVHLQDHEALLREYIADRAVDGIPYPSGQDRVPVLRHQHHVVLQEETAETAVAVRIVRLPFLLIRTYVRFLLYIHLLQWYNYTMK